MNVVPRKVLRISALFLVLAVIASTLFLAAESQQAQALSATDQVIVTLTVDAGITISNAPDTTMSRNLGVAVDTAIGTTTWNVRTNNALGYTLFVRATNTPAMTSTSNSIPDYGTATTTLWNVANGSAFGYSAFGTDVSTGSWGTGGNCASTAHMPSGTLRYRGFTTSDHTVATRSGTTTTLGIDTTVCYAVEQDTFFIPSGTYRATIIATATTL